jgi:hypothetical protein
MIITKIILRSLGIRSASRYRIPLRKSQYHWEISAYKGTDPLTNMEIISLIKVEDDAFYSLIAGEKSLRDIYDVAVTII